jgi:hypothetical protein
MRMPSSAVVHVHLQGKTASYRRFTFLSGTEHGWNYTRMLRDIAREEVDIRTHGIVHLKYHMEM